MVALGCPVWPVSSVLHVCRPLWPSVLASPCIHLWPPSEHELPRHIEAKAAPLRNLPHHGDDVLHRGKVQILAWRLCGTSKLPDQGCPATLCMHSSTFSVKQALTQHRHRHRHPPSENIAWDSTAATYLSPGVRASGLLTPMRVSSRPAMQ